MKKGNWVYEKSNETLVFTGRSYRNYEVDLERGTMTSWLEHLSHKVNHVLSRKDFFDLYEILNKLKELKPNLPIFNNKEPSYIRISLDAILDGIKILPDKKII